MLVTKNPDGDISEKSYQRSAGVKTGKILAETSFCGEWNLEFGSNTTEQLEIASPQIQNVISRNTVSKNEEIRLGDMTPERWRNWRKGVRGPQ